MEEKLDLRVRKTYLALTQALLAMMEEMRFEDIRVSELCDRAMVRKSTFYKHFADKYELLTFTVRQMQSQLNSQLAAEFREGNVVEYYTRLAELVLKRMSENGALVESTLRSNSFPLILSILSDQIILDIRGKLKEDALKGERLPVPPEMMAAFFVGGVMEMLRCWLQKGRRLDEKELIEQFRTMLDLFYSAASVKE